MAGMFLAGAGAIYYPFSCCRCGSASIGNAALAFCAGVVLTIGLLIGMLALRADNLQMFVQDCGRRLPVVAGPGKSGGFWGFSWMIPSIGSVLALFVVLAGVLPCGRPQKNLGTLMSCTAALMLGCQFWHAHGGGQYMAWYLPVLLLTIFRPNLEDRIALSVLGKAGSRAATPPPARRKGSLSGTALAAAFARTAAIPSVKCPPPGLAPFRSRTELPWRDAQVDDAASDDWIEPGLAGRGDQLIALRCPD